MRSIKHSLHSFARMNIDVRMKATRASCYLELMVDSRMYMCGSMRMCVDRHPCKSVFNNIY